MEDARDYPQHAKEQSNKRSDSERTKEIAREPLRRDGVHFTFVAHPRWHNLPPLAKEPQPFLKYALAAAAGED